MQKGYVDIFDSVEDAVRAVGDPLVLTKLGLVVKERPDCTNK